MNQDDIVIVAAKRTSQGNLLGSLSSLSAPELAAHTNKDVISSANISASDIDEVITGCVLQAGVGQGPARQAAIGAGIPVSAGATTINKLCGSGMKAVMLAHDLIKVGSAEIVLAGGMESMSNAPYLLKKARQGYRVGHGELKDHMFFDGLEDVYTPGTLMGKFAEQTAQKYNYTRQQQDDFAINSMTKAITAQENGDFTAEITPITITSKKGSFTIDKDECPDANKIGKIPKLKPAFDPNGSVTAASSSSISDGAASLLLMTAENAKKRGITPLAKIVAHATFSQDPEWFTTAPVNAIKNVLQKSNWHTDDVDLFEINEAFAVVTMAAITDLELNPEKVNIQGGACALGHPIGASGARILVTLIHSLRRLNKTKGVAALCIGGGEATAMAIEVEETSHV
ncbi:MAG: acetyl-CoA C-acyltransferase [Legionellaceae bacterium]|nr:acetyl-CoA C-acyltransferase [Legionellaceae bacterium]